MRIWGFLVACGMLLAWPASPASARSQASLLSVGQITCRNAGFSLQSTATLIEDSRTLLTVAHFNWHDGEEISPSDCRFRLFDVGGERVFASDFEIAKVGGSRFDVRTSRATDWAILRLADAAPASVEPLRLYSGRNLSAREAALVGFFASASEPGSTRARHCRVRWFEQSSAVLRHDCATAPGTSGSPLVVRKGGVRYLLAIHTGRAEGQGIAALVARSPAFQRALRGNALESGEALAYRAR